MAKYEAVVEACRRIGVVTPEDPYVVWPEEPRCVIAPLFLLYDYSFGPDSVGPEGAAAWAAETGIRCADEHYLAPDPYPSRAASWHRRYRAKVVVAGHLHVRTTDWIDGVRFEEVSLGYPRHWRRERGVDGYLREILPGPREVRWRDGPVHHR